MILYTCAGGYESAQNICAFCTFEDTFSFEAAHLYNLNRLVKSKYNLVVRKPASENVVCLCRLLHLLANFSNILFAYRQTVWTKIRLLLEEQSDLGPHCLQ